MQYSDVAPSSLPTFLLPCTHCGRQLVITAITRTRIADGTESNDLKDVTHACVRCGTMLTRTVGPVSGDADVIARRG